MNTGERSTRSSIRSRNLLVIPALKQTEAIPFKKRPKREFSLSIPAFLVAAVGLLVLMTTPIRSAPAEEGEVESLLKRGSELYRTHHLAPGRFERAIQYYETALSQSPGDYRILWKLSEMYQNFGQQLRLDQRREKIASWKRGNTYGKKAVETNPDGKEGHFYYLANMGALAEIRGTLFAFWKFQKIRGEMERAAELDPDYPPLLLAKAQYLLKMPQLFGGSEQGGPSPVPAGHREGPYLFPGPLFHGPTGRREGSVRGSRRPAGEDAPVREPGQSGQLDEAPPAPG